MLLLTYTTVPECETEAQSYLEGQYERDSSQFCNKAVIAEWNYNTNLTSADAEAAASEASIALANFQFKQWNDTIRHWDYETFTDQAIKRQLNFLNIIGEAALNATDLNRVSDAGRVQKKYEKGNFLFEMLCISSKESFCHHQTYRNANVFAFSLFPLKIYKRTLTKNL